MFLRENMSDQSKAFAKHQSKSTKNDIHKATEELFSYPFSQAGILYLESECVVIELQ